PSMKQKRSLAVCNRRSDYHPNLTERVSWNQVPSNHSRRATCLPLLAKRGEGWGEEPIKPFKHQTKRSNAQGARQNAPASWTAAAPCRFSHASPRLELEQPSANFTKRPSYDSSPLRGRRSAEGRVREKAAHIQSRPQFYMNRSERWQKCP